VEYQQDEFFALMEQVEDQGGDHLPERCKAQRYTFTGDQIKPVTLPSCGNETLFSIPYVGEKDKPSAITVCAVDDNMGMWPRFAGVMNDDS
jgi:hypothetical protein